MCPRSVCGCVVGWGLGEGDGDRLEGRQVETPIRSKEHFNLLKDSFILMANRNQQGILQNSARISSSFSLLERSPGFSMEKGLKATTLES